MLAQAKAIAKQFATKAKDLNEWNPHNWEVKDNIEKGASGIPSEHNVSEAVEDLEDLFIHQATAQEWRTHCFELLRRYGLDLANSYAPLGSCLPCQGDGRTHTAASLGYVQGSAARVRLERPYPLTAKLPMRATTQERLDGGHPAAAPRHLCRSRPRKCHSRSKLRGLSASTNPEQELAAAE